MTDLKKMFPQTISGQIQAWSPETIEAKAKGFKSMSKERFAKRTAQFAAEGEAKRAEQLAELKVPPFVLRALASGDKATVKAFRTRRGAEFDFETWAKAQGVEL